MGKAWDILGIIFGIVVVFLLVYYWRGVVAVTEAGGRALTDTIGALQGKDAFGRLPTQYPN